MSGSSINKSHNVPTNLGDLPPETALEIAEGLDNQSLVSFAQTCGSLYGFLSPLIKKRAQSAAFAPRHLYEENFGYDNHQQHGVDEPPLLVTGSYCVPERGFGATNLDILGQAVEAGELGVVRSFLAYGVCPNSYIASGERLLNLAIASLRTDMVNLLLEFGADPSKQDLITNLSPLVRAAQCRSEEILLLLIRAGANLNEDTVRQAIAHYFPFRHYRGLVPI
ncbi:uncharacterized protein N7482_002802 [Penicillium canariense]|uniref:Uncharacterized protein n=1 Tax=Penicillium canariense TaxID=189055 RepID=A0A9W9IGS0_9EURO|nr:uncharacterized protein N7482_002802 [Penicillium canariense]KAJ5176925.1 hypothetical protein N7482_002802 [Penicillium canariense]